MDFGVISDDDRARYFVPVGPLNLKLGPRADTPAETKALFRTIRRVVAVHKGETDTTE